MSHKAVCIPTPCRPVKTVPLLPPDPRCPWSDKASCHLLAQPVTLRLFLRPKKILQAAETDAIFPEKHFPTLVEFMKNQARDKGYSFAE
jgi:hypothetical protein